MNYATFIESKTQSSAEEGFLPTFIPQALFDFQTSLVNWSLRQGRSAVLADCGLGKTPIQLTWAENIVRRENARVLVLTPLAVSSQTLREGEKFGIECLRSRDGLNLPVSGIVVTNYERLEKFDPSDFIGVVCDESSILKSFDGVRRQQITDFMRKMKYRLLCTATASPNDYIELGTSSEALGHLGYMDMLHRFFVAEDGRGSAARRGWGKEVKFRLKGHAEEAFWRWVCSWARAVRYPSDLGFPDNDFILPPLNETIHIVEAIRPPSGQLIEIQAEGLRDQREAMRRTVDERCERMAELVSEGPALVWCNLNQEGDLLERLIPGAIQVSGADADEIKEERFDAFVRGEARVLVTKPKIGAWGLNFQHCNHVGVFPTHSFEQYYQGIRRCWRFGQKSPVQVDVVGTDGLRSVMDNLGRKAKKADDMFKQLVLLMQRGQSITSAQQSTSWSLPLWMR